MGGVKRISLTYNSTGYTNWFLHEHTRDELFRALPKVHPMLYEYICRLHLRARYLDAVVQRVTSEATSQSSANMMQVAEDHIRALEGPTASAEPFRFSKWQQLYTDALDETEEFFKLFNELNDNIVMFHDTQRLINESNGNGDAAELLAMTSEEIDVLISKLQPREEELVRLAKQCVSAADVIGRSSRTWVLEVVGRAGGEEASLFAEELREVYKHYAEHQEWRWEPVMEESAATGTVESKTKLQLTGDSIYSHIKHEIGVHKVQRVPVTGHGDGKMQTSTAVVTLMPVLDPVNVNVNESDCTIDFVRGSGPGGQGMQSSSNACVLTHRPSGITVKCHQSRSALGNKELALQMVAQQLLQQQAKAQQDSQDSVWANQWSSGERSEKLRTYNFPQNRVTDHRLGKDYPLGSFLEGRREMQELHDAMNAVHETHATEVALRKTVDEHFKVPHDDKVPPLR